MRKFYILLFFLLSSYSFSTLFAQDLTCLDCHQEHSLTKSINDSTEVSVYVDTTQLAQSVHADLECTDCHAVGADHPNGGPVPDPTCSNCHDDEQEDYAKSIHGKAYSNGNKTAANCWSCHGAHNIRAQDDSTSMVNNRNLLTTCGSCHSRPDIMKQFGGHAVDPVAAFKESIHGKIFTEDPEAPVANCVACHGSHAILPVIEPEAKLNKLNIPKTCGACHVEEEKEYYQSIHWDALRRGHYEAPVCTDCHGEHNIHLAEGAKSVTNPKLQATKLCASCHSSPSLMGKFGLDPHRLDSYMKTYHGLAVLKGSPRAATCTSCHEVHAIRSSTDSLSTVFVGNRQKTCGQCHQNVSKDFANIDVHPVTLKGRNPVAYFFKIMYTWMIILVIGGMFLHNFIILFYYIRQKWNTEKNEPRYQRFQRGEVYEHFLLFLAFFFLAVTGFALKFPNAGWVKLLVSIGMDETVRSVVHRIAAVTLAILSLIQLYRFVMTHKGRKDFLSLIPTRDDLTQIYQNLRFYLGLSKTRPKFGRYDYAAKAEYLALMWGNMVMGLTGFTLWFPEIVMRYSPTWVFETFQVIHYFEAWLAVLAILVWHMFFVIFHPEKYPMDFTWIDGKIAEEEFKHEHPLEYKELIENKEK